MYAIIGTSSRLLYSRRDSKRYSGRDVATTTPADCYDTFQQALNAFSAGDFHLGTYTIEKVEFNAPPPPALIPVFTKIDS